MEEEGYLQGADEKEARALFIRLFNKRENGLCPGTEVPTRIAIKKLPGRKSDVFDICARVETRHNRPLRPYMLKKYKTFEDPEKDFDQIMDYITEKSALSLDWEYGHALKRADLLPPLDAYDDGERTLLLGTVVFNSIEEMVDESKKGHTWESAGRVLSGGLYPIGVQHVVFSKLRGEIEGAIRRFAPEFVKNAGIIDEQKAARIRSYSALKVLDREFYYRKTEEYAKRKDLPIHLRQKVFMAIAKIYESLTVPSMYVVCNRDGYSWHNLQKSLVDMGDLCWASCGVHLGGYLGFSRMFNSLGRNKEKSIDALMQDYAGIVAELRKIVGEEPQEANLQALKKAVYAGAIFSNLRYRASLDCDTLEEQLATLARL